MFFFPRLKNYSLLSLPPPESNIAIKNKRKPRVARYYSNFKTRSRLEMDESDSYLLLSLLLPRQFQFPSETTQHPPLSFPSPSLFLFIYKFVTLTHSLVGRKMFVEEFLTARTSSSQQQIYRISIFTISIYVANMLYNSSVSR